MELTREPVELSDLLRDVEGIVSPDLDAKGQTLSLSSSESPLWVYADRARLQQVFWNLLKNAIRFSPPRAAITLKLVAAGDRVRVSVIDPGEPSINHPARLCESCSLRITPTRPA